jgi:hypothetical protein
MRHKGYAVEVVDGLVLAAFLHPAQVGVCLRVQVAHLSSLCATAVDALLIGTLADNCHLCRLVEPPQAVVWAVECQKAMSEQVCKETVTGNVDDG